MKKKALGANERDESKWPKCLFWIAKCARFCSGERAPGSKYCINHIHMDPSYTPPNDATSRKRVVCPIDPSHTVFEDKLSKHIKICNKSKQTQQKQQCPYYVENFNCGSEVQHESPVFDSQEAVFFLVHDFTVRSSSSRSSWSERFVLCIMSSFPTASPCMLFAPLPLIPLLQIKQNVEPHRTRFAIFISK